MVMPMTRVSDQGIARSVRGRRECQSTVVAATMIITATRPAMGMRPTVWPNTRMRMSRKTPAISVDSRVRARAPRTLIIVCPIIAHTPMPVSYTHL